MKNLLIITILLMIGLGTSCKKEETTTPAKSKKEIISSKTWIISDVSALSGAVTIYKRGNSPANNQYDLDKVSLTFKTDGTLTGTDNNGNSVSAAKWALSTDETKLTISGTGIVGLDGELTVIQITETLLEVKGKATVQGITADANIKAIPK